MFEHILQHLNHDDLIITVNQRLSSYLHEQARHVQHQSGLNTWPTPHIMSLSTYLESCWQQLSCMTQIAPPPLLLTQQQAQLLWRDIITDSAYSEHLLNIEATLHLAQQAWQLVQQWQLSDTDLQASLQLDNQVFTDWQHQFKQLLIEQHYITAEQLLAYFANHQALTELCPFKQVFVLGFDDYYPSLRDFLNQLAQLGKAITYPDVVSQQAVTHAVAFEHMAQEIRAVACWAKQQGPQKRVGIIIPDLHHCHQQVTQIFSEILVPQKCLNSQDLSPLPFNVSGGYPLSDWPLLAIIAHVLQAAHTNIPLTTISSLLRSPYLAANEQALSQQALFDQYLRRQNQLHVSSSQLLRLYEQYPWHDNYQRFFALVHANKSPQSPYAWAQHFQQLLRCLGWPGYHSLNTIEYQLQQAWLELLEQFKQLSLIKPQMSFATARYHLMQLMKNSHFQIQSTKTNIHILGILESTGIPFDAIWLLNLNDQTWPAPARPNPFIDKQLQQQRLMPHANNQRELLFSQQVMQRLQQQSPLIYASYHQYQAEQRCNASPLIADWPKINIDEVLSNTPLPLIEQLHQQGQLNLVTDLACPVIITNENHPGGSWILSEQARCPFRAFAKFRLQAEGIAEPQAGLDALQRGVFVHHVLEQFWQQVKTQHALKQLSAIALDGLLQQCISSTLQHCLSPSQRQQQTRLLQIEQTRLQQLIKQWLAHEQQRPSFKVVATEQQQQLSFHGLHLQLRLDRLDRLANGDYVLIDYKTGISHLGAWFDERPDAPQLPLYCITSELPISGLAYAQIRTEAMCFRGLCIDPQALPGTLAVEQLAENDTWPALLQHWQQHLGALAEGFMQGHALVDPKYGETSCDYCEFRSLCRVQSSEAAHD